MRTFHEWRRSGLSAAILGLGALLPGLSRAGMSRPTSVHKLVLRGVTVVDIMTGERLAAQTVVVVGNRIQAVGPAQTTPIPAGAEEVDARGKYLIPGLWDMHQHTPPGSQHIRWGVTGTRQPADGLNHFLEAERQRAVVGARVAPPRQVNSFGFLPGYYERDSATVVHLVDSAKALGFDLVKTSGDDQRLFYILAAEARRVGIRFGGHIEEKALSILDVVDSGTSIIDHTRRTSGGLDRLCVRNASPKYQTATLATCREAVARLRRHGTWWVLTLVDGNTGISPGPLMPTTRSLRIHAGESGRVEACLRAKDLPDTPPWLSLQWLRDSARFDPAKAPDAPIDTGGALALMYRAGMPILAGTDQMDASSIHVELALMVSEGLPPLAALQTATLNPAKFLHATDSLGSVTPGKLADLVLLDADPLVDITNTTRIWAVVANGRYFDRAALDLMDFC